MINKLRYTIQRVLPIVYDDSLSYMELLGKVVQKVNEVISIVNDIDGEIINQISVILDSWLEDGTLAEIINEEIFDGLDARIAAAESDIDALQAAYDTADGQIIALNRRINAAETNLLNTNSALTRLSGTVTQNKNSADSAISNISAATADIADALDIVNARIDSILDGASVDPDAELIDIRVSFTGQTYAAAGDAVRGIDSILYNRISNKVKTTVYKQYSLDEAVETYEHKRLNSSGELVDDPDTNVYIFRMSEGRYIHTSTQNNMFYVDADLNVIGMNDTPASNTETTCYTAEIKYTSPYFAIAYYRYSAENESSHFIRISNFYNCTGFWDFGLRNAQEIRFVNGELQEDIEYEEPENMGEGFPYITNGTHGGTGSGIYSLQNMKFKRGTKISAMYNTCFIDLRGINAEGSFFINSDTVNREYVIPFDCYGCICFSLNYASESKMPVGWDMSTFVKFITITPPEDNIRNWWSGKDWYCYGTSLSDIGTKEEYNTTSVIGDGNNGAMGTYPLMIDSIGGMVRHNGAIGSGGIVPSQDHHGNLKVSIMSCPSTADLVTLEIGPNDPYATALGDIGDTGNDTLLGNLYQCFNYLVNNVNGRIVLLLVQNNIYNNGIKYSAVSNNQKQWKTACQKMAELADYFGIPVINVNGNAIDYGHQTTGVTLVDDIHYNYLGGAIAGRYIWNKIRQIPPAQF